MKKTFKEYYAISEDNIKSIILNKTINTLFVFDTNVLISLYELHPNARTTLFKTIEYVKERVWMPYQVGYEFNRNRYTHLSTHSKQLNIMRKDVKDEIDRIQEKFNNKKLFDGVKNKEIDDQLAALKESTDNFLDSKYHESIESEKTDTVLDQLYAIFTDTKIGKPLAKNQYDALIKVIDQQWASNNGVGFKDKASKEKQFSIYPGDFLFCNAYGDPVIIEEIKNAILEQNKGEIKIKNLVFITNDNKGLFALYG